MNSEEYQVTIKSATVKVEDYIILSRRDWTVKQLKEAISSTHPNKPAIHEQRLIYGGSLLNDTHALKQIFFRDSLCTDSSALTKTDFTIHLVLSQRSSVSNNKNDNNISKSTSNNHHQQQPSSSTNTTIYPSHARQMHSPQTTTNATTTPHTTTDASTNLTDTPGASNEDGNPSNSTLNSDSTTNISPDQQAFQSLMQTEFFANEMQIFQDTVNAVAEQMVQYIAAQNGGRQLEGDIATSNSQQSQTSRAGSSRLCISFQQINVDGTDANFHDLLSFVGRSVNVTQASRSNIQQTNSPIDRQENDRNANQDARYADVAQMNLLNEQQENNFQQNGEPEEVQNELFQWIFYSFRAMVIFLAISFNTSIVKMMLIAGLLTIVYLYRRTNRRAAAQANVQQPQQQAQMPEMVRVAPPRAPGEEPRGAEPRDQVNNNNDDNSNTNENDRLLGNQAENSQNQQASENEQVAAQDPQETRPVSVIKMIYLIVLTFITSLVPE